MYQLCQDLRNLLLCAAPAAPVDDSTTKRRRRRSIRAGDNTSNAASSSSTLSSSSSSLSSSTWSSSSRLTLAATLRRLSSKECGGCEVVTLALNSVPPRRLAKVWAAIRAAEANRVVSVDGLPVHFMPELVAALQQSLARGVEVNLGGLGPGEAALFAGLVARNTPLRVLNLQWNDLGNLGAELLARALAHDRNTSLVSLNLCHNGIDDRGLLPLCEALHTNRTLQVLNLFWNQISPAGLASLLSVVQSSSSISALREVDVHVNRITAMQTLGFYRAFASAKTRRGLVVLWMRGSPCRRLPGELMAMVMEMVDK